MDGVFHGKSIYKWMTPGGSPISGNLQHGTYAWNFGNPQLRNRLFCNHQPFLGFHSESNSTITSQLGMKMGRCCS